MASILFRPLDLFLVLSFFAFSVIAITIDFTQAVHGDLGNLKADVNRLWPPDAILEYYRWWCEEVDVLLAVNPLWYKILAVFSPLVYLPYYIAAIYAFLNEREWIRAPTLMWGWGLLLSMVPIVAEQTMGKHAAKDVKMFWLAYGMYIIVPLLAILRVAMLPVFRAHKTTSNRERSRHKYE